jgi:hypothetical protein
LKITDLATRIKWKPVLALLLVIIVAAFLLFGFPSIQSPLQEKWKGDGDIQEMSWPDPSRVETDGVARAKVEVRNVGKESADVKIKLSADDASLTFEEGGNTQEVNASISLGPKEIRELSFKVNFNATYAGKYRVKVTISPAGENIVDEIFFDVKEKK